MKSKIFALLASLFSKKIVIVLVAMLPIFELRLAIPLGVIKFNLSVFEAYFLSLLGNLVPVFPLLIFFNCFFHRLENLKFFGKIFRWWFSRVERNSRAVNRWGFWGLVFFVAIPLPVTGAWTGTVAATLVKMKPKKAFLAIALGVALAGLIVSVLSLVAKETIAAWLNFV